MIVADHEFYIHRQINVRDALMYAHATLPVDSVSNFTGSHDSIYSMHFIPARKSNYFEEKRGHARLNS